ncbi:MAG: hypothetical protein AVDCRST_MAG53-2678 [uncultured Solirubrobacteraceae bacterium]|uniref:Uncharacterized protein n=1 Tax=uncultured Solirubrobacteraceae bacterium TaxID=1162706 RepID=A0A6J4T349_9ACTN|nr:MAG: hypothetical protein AVDCRST_MAG53-2678 [uncultured Solirubrobacteraceae bacterium]
MGVGARGGGTGHEADLPASPGREAEARPPRGRPRRSGTPSASRRSPRRAA